MAAGRAITSLSLGRARAGRNRRRAPRRTALLTTSRLAPDPVDSIVRAEGMGWPRLILVLLGMVAGYRARLVITFVLGVARVVALIGVGVLSALIVCAVKNGMPLSRLLVALALAAPLAGLLHWLESWLAHDMAYRLLNDMRLDIFRKLDALAPAYFTRRRTGDLVGVATHDVEDEYFFATRSRPPSRVLVPLALVTSRFRMARRWRCFPSSPGRLTPVRPLPIDRLGSRGASLGTYRACGGFVRASADRRLPSRARALRRIGAKAAGPADSMPFLQSDRSRLSRRCVRARRLACGAARAGDCRPARRRLARSSRSSRSRFVPVGRSPGQPPARHTCSRRPRHACMLTRARHDGAA